MIIKNAELIDYRGRNKADILIDNGLITFIGNIDKKEYKDHVIVNAENKIVLPSFVDLHVHFREPGFTEKEDIETGSKAAVKGGYTVCNAMANTNPIVDNPKVLNCILERSREVGLIDLFQVMTVTKAMEGKELVDFSSIPDSVPYLSDDGKGILSNHIMLQACINAKKFKKGIMVHAEDPEISPYDYRVAEDINTIRDIYLSYATGAKIHMSHVSTRASIEAIRIGKSKNIPVTCEVTPHHIALSGLDFKVNPPIRTNDDIDAIVEGIIDGTVDAIATDHAPHTENDKKSGAPGSIGLESSFAICYTKLVKTNIISIEKLSKIMSFNPARILGINHGIIEVGFNADLVIIDLNKKSQLTNEYFYSKSKNSVFKGMTFDSEICMTLRRGEIVYENN